MTHSELIESPSFSLEIGPTPPLPGQPQPYGRVHPTLQQVDPPSHDVASLRAYLGTCGVDPVLNWQSAPAEVSHQDVTTWFPNQEDRVAFFTPSPASDREYESLSYAELHRQIRQTPAFSSRGKLPVHVALWIPLEQMAELATVLVCVMAQRGVTAIPLDPRMPRAKLVQAMEQLHCQILVSVESLLVDRQILQPATVTNISTNCAAYDTHESTRGNSSSSYFAKHVQEIRILRPLGGGRLHWTVLQQQHPSQVTWSPTAVPHVTHVDLPPRLPEDDDGDAPALFLRTSGTTAMPKIVPISRHMLLYGSITIAAALKLQRCDVNANSMPLFHIGGIACNLLAVLVSGGSVLFAGPLVDPNAFVDHLILGGTTAATTTNNSDHSLIQPTWYYAGPTMHKAIVCIAEARRQEIQHASHQLRLIRSASAHLSHDLALRLSSVFQCAVIPTYGMSEAMPIASSAPIDARCQPPCEVMDSVGFATGTAIRILHSETGDILKHHHNRDDGKEPLVGEICVAGAAVIAHYQGLSPASTHTPDGYLRTGDCGYLDRQGRLFIKGRTKEMIKRGGEQVWPNEIDDVIEKLSGVVTAVAFGVPNELWGEEVAVAVVVDGLSNVESLREEIVQACRDQLDPLSVPQQIKFLTSTDQLVKGSTGKYIRTQMASYLGVTAVDTGALRVLTSISNPARANEETVVTSSINPQEMQQQGQALWDMLNTTSNEGRRFIPSEALNGLRFLVACAVVHVHVGRFPNLPWVKLQAYQPNMIIFFTLAAFQITCSVARSVKGQWANFVGTKIGCLHSLFVIAQIYTLPSYILFNCFDENGNMKWTTSDWIEKLSLWLFATVTGLGHGFDVNKYTWFQSTLYLFLAGFPFVDHYLRRQTLKLQIVLLVLLGALASSILGILYITVPSDVFFGPIYPFSWTIISWAPLLLATTLAAYVVRRLAEYYYEQKLKDDASRMGVQQQEADEGEPDTIMVTTIQDYCQLWGRVCDCCSFLLLLAAIIVMLAPNCLCAYANTYLQMRPGEALPSEECRLAPERDEYVWACGITYDEWVNYVQPDPYYKEYGRFFTMFSGAFGYMRTSVPLFVLWIVSMAFGQSYTARLFQSRIMGRLAPLGYPVYLLHMATARYYWLATRGLQPQPWWHLSGEYPFPVEWYEFFTVLFLTIVIGALVQAFLVPLLMPYSILFGVTVCKWISSTIQSMPSCLCPRTSKDGKTDSLTDPERNSDIETDCASDAVESKTYRQVQRMVRGLTGVEVTPNLQLRHLGLDSLGAVALLGMLRSSVPAAQKLTLQELQKCDTVGMLSTFLDEPGSTSSSLDENVSLEDVPL